jgi:hypothetical protein
MCIGKGRSVIFGDEAIRRAIELSGHSIRGYFLGGFYRSHSLIGFSILNFYREFYFVMFRNSTAILLHVEEGVQ